MPAKRLLVTDLDNTLWDWFEAWYQSFSRMLTTLTERSGVDQAVLEDQMRRIHQARGTAEYSNLIAEVPALVAAAAPRNPTAVYDDALHVMHSQRKAQTRLYPGVRESLNDLKERGVRVVAYTESTAYWTEWRIRHTGLDGTIDILYSGPEHELPHGMAPADLRTGLLPSSSYGLKSTLHRHLPREVRKPDEDVLRDILADEKCAPDECVYIGDSLMKDIAMAQAAGVLDVHALYGVVQDRPEYELLRRVSHWSDEEIAREASLRSNATGIEPTVTVNNFSEVLPIFDVAAAVR